MADRLIEFYGTECVHCRNMDNSIERLEKELNVKVTRLEVWHNEDNAKLWKKMDEGFCGGVPLFINTKTNQKICGAVDYPNFNK